MGTITIQPPDWRRERAWRRVTVLLSFLLGFLLALACFGFWMYSSYREKEDLEGRLAREKRQTQALSALNAETNQKLAAIESDLNLATTKLTVSLGRLEKVQAEPRVRESDEQRLSSNHRNFSDPVWNAWSEPFSSDKVLFAPQKLQPARDYSFVINLAALPYDQDKSAKDSGVYSQEPDSSFLDSEPC
jgi:hypothetical protein